MDSSLTRLFNSEGQRVSRVDKRPLRAHVQRTFRALSGLQRQGTHMGLGEQWVSQSGSRGTDAEVPRGFQGKKKDKY